MKNISRKILLFSIAITFFSFVNPPSSKEEAFNFLKNKIETFSTNKALINSKFEYNPNTYHIKYSYATGIAHDVWVQWQECNLQDIFSVVVEPFHEYHIVTLKGRKDAVSKAKYPNFTEKIYVFEIVFEDKIIANRVSRAFETLINEAKEKEKF